MSHSRRTLLTLSAAALAAPFLGHPARAAVQGISGRAFGTGWRVVLPSGTPMEGLEGEIRALLHRIDGQMSPWRADSEVSRFNAGPAGGVRVSPGTAEVAGAAIWLAERSGGAFDPTVGPLVARWGFGPIEGAHGADWRALEVGDGVISKAEAGATVDLCGIAKGWALDRMVGLLDRRGYGSFLIDLGGELYARGRHPDGRPWRAGVEDPRVDAAGLSARVVLEDAAVATSGLKANGYSLGGRRYGHIIAPARAAPVDGGWDQVTVLARSAMMADGWATALMAAGRDGPGLAEREGLAALFLAGDGAAVRRRVTGGMARVLV